jgi:hypothetical protein
MRNLVETGRVRLCAVARICVGHFACKKLPVLLATLLVWKLDSVGQDGTGLDAIETTQTANKELY